MSAPKMPFFFSSYKSGVSTDSHISSDGFVEPLPKDVADLSIVSTGTDEFLRGLEMSLKSLALATQCTQQGAQKDAATSLIAGVSEARASVRGIGSCVDRVETNSPVAGPSKIKP